MTALVGLKQKIRSFYGKYELYFVPFIKFAVAFLYFYWITQNMGYLEQLDNTFVLLVFSLLCSILPPVFTTACGFILMIGHALGIGLEAGGFMAFLIVLLLIFFLRLSNGQSIVVACVPICFGLDAPALLPIGSALMGDALSAFPAGCGVVLYYFVRQLRVQAPVLSGDTLGPLEKLQLMVTGDGALMNNWAMWLTIIAYVAVILVVNLIRTRSINYAWRIAIIAGGVLYVLVMYIGSFYFRVRILAGVLALQTMISVVIGLIMEILFFGGDYARAEKLQFEDDDYYYYVKVIPKAYALKSTSRRNSPSGDYRSAQEGEGASRGEGRWLDRKAQKKKEDVSDVDFRKKLEESLRDL